MYLTCHRSDNVVHTFTVSDKCWNPRAVRFTSMHLMLGGCQYARTGELQNERFCCVYIAVEFPHFEDQYIGGNNCRVVCVYKWNVIVNSYIY